MSAYTVSSVQIDIWHCTRTMSRHTEVSRYYPEFPECQEIKRMRKQWIPGPFPMRLVIVIVVSLAKPELWNVIADNNVMAELSTQSSVS